MEQIAEKITQNFLQKLPDQAQSLTPDELHSSGIPHFVVETVRKNAASAVESDLTMPASEWLQMNHEQVQSAWQDFIERSGQHLLIPGDKLENVLNEAVKQSLQLALKPREAVPEIIFGNSKMVDLKTARERVHSIKINKQLGLALLRYMERKEKDEIELEKAQTLVSIVDERLVEDYHPLKWAESLKPVFDLAGPAVDPQLFRIFFEDKEKPVYARKFEQLDEPLNKSAFIEALSSADVLDVEGYEEEQSGAYIPVEEEADPEEGIEIDETSDHEKVISGDDEEVSEEISEDEEVPVRETDEFRETEEEEFFEEDRPEQVEEPVYEEEEISGEDNFTEDDEDEEEEENIVNLFSKISEIDRVEDDEEEMNPVFSVVEKEEDTIEEEENITLLSKFIFDESEPEEEKEVPEESTVQKEPASIYDEMNLVKDEPTAGEDEQDFVDEDEIEGDEEFSYRIQSDEYEEEEFSGDDYPDEQEQVDVESGDDEEDQPMWRSFLERDDIETDSGYEYEDEEPDEVEEDEFGEQVESETNQPEEEEDDGFIEEPIYDLTTDQDGDEEKMNRISGWLDDEKDRFVDQIFMGSEFAYEQALADITDFENWKAASMYLESEVFSRNKVDVYDEVAVDFTDRLHSYFVENNSNSDNE